MVEKVLSRLIMVKAIGQNRYKACCPAHADTDPSLYISVTDSGKILMHCFSGCAKEDILSAIGLSFGDLMGDNPTHHRLRPVAHHLRQDHIPLQKGIDMDSYYRTVLDIADSDAMKGIQSSSEDLKLIGQAMAYLNAKQGVQEPDLLEFEAKRQRGERLTKSEINLERKMWLRRHRSGKI